MVVWAVFLCATIVLIALDFGARHRNGKEVHPKEVHPKEALAWTAFWIAAAMAFNAFVYALYDARGWGFAPDLDYSIGARAAAQQFAAAYLLAKFLSLENVIVIALILSCFPIPPNDRDRMLYWAVALTIVTRVAMIFVGSSLIAHYPGTIYVFSAILLFSAVKILLQRHKACDLKDNWPIRCVRRILPVTDDTSSGRIITVVDGTASVTPIFLALFMLGMASFRFSLDTAAAVVSVSYEPFIAITATVFSFLGLRALYFCVAGVIGRFRYIRISLAFTLGWVAIRILLARQYPVTLLESAAVAGIILAVGIIASAVALYRYPQTFAGAGASRALITLSWHQARRVIAIVFGTTLILLGTAMLVLPGPGLLTIAGGLAILSTEVVWARVLLNKVRAKLGRPEDDETERGRDES